MRLLKKLFMLVFFTGLFIFLQSCSVQKVAITSIAMSEECPNEVLINRFELEDYEIVVNYSNGETRKVQVTDEMVDASSYLSIVKNEGKHTLTVTYKGFSFDYDITVKCYEFTDVELLSQTFVYDGEYHSLEVTGNIPDNTLITFKDKNSYKNFSEDGYTVTAILSNDLYISKTLTNKLYITKADYDLSKLTFEQKQPYTYDGTAKSVSVEGLDKNINIKYYIGEEETNSKIDAGTYTVTAVFETSLNYNDIPSMTTTLTIDKGTYNMSYYQFNNKTVYYSGQRVEMRITNYDSLPYGVSVSYEGLDEAINAGVYPITAHFIGNPNYYPIEPLTATLTIKQASVALNGVYLDSQSIVYDGKEHLIEYSGTKPNSILFTGYTIYDEESKLVYDSNSTEEHLKHKAINAGIYLIYASFSYRDSKNYAPIDPLSATLEITKATITDIVINNEVKEYKENLGQSLTVTTSLEGITPHPSISNPVEPGDYSITYTFTLSEELARNYEVPEPITRTLSITKKSLATRLSNGRFTYEFDNTVKTIDVNLTEEEKEWIIPNYFTLSNSNETPFTGAKNPGTYLVFIKYTIDTSKAPTNYQNYYYIPVRDSAYLIITKRNLLITDDMLTNQMFTFDGNEKVVTLIANRLIEANPALTANNFEVSYNDNHATNRGYYNGSLNIVLKGDITSYYNNVDEYNFAYAIRNTSDNESEDYSLREPITPLVLEKQFSYDGLTHSVKISSMPAGVTAKFDGNNSLTLPGKVDTYVTFYYDNDVAKWYYSFPTLSDKDIYGNYRMGISLVVNKIEYTPELEIPTYVYDPDAGDRGIKAAKLISGVDIQFVYEKDERVDVGVYKVNVITTITNTDLLKIYVVESKMSTTFEIVKADYRYSFSGLSAKYDGEPHCISVVGLERNYEKGDLTWTITGDNQVDVGSYNVVVSFTNNSKNYNNIPNQSVTLVIDNTKVNCNSIVTFVNSNDFIYVRQFESLQSIFTSFIDLKPFSLSWKLDYYENPELISFIEDETRHGSGDKTTDFELAQYTESQGYVLVEFTLTFNKGYVCGDEAFDGTYHAFIKIKVRENEQIYITDFLNNIHEGADVLQDKNLNEYFDLLSDELTYSYTATYYNGEEQYKAPYVATGTNETDFNLKYNTWGNRYVLIDFTIKAPFGLSINDGSSSYREYKQQVKVNVPVVSTIDVSGLLVEATINRYTLAKEAYNELIDMNYVTYFDAIYDGADPQNRNLLAYTYNNYRFTNVLEGGYYLVYTFYPINDSYQLYWVHQNSYLTWFSSTTHLTVLNVDATSIDNFVNSVNAMNSTYDQYTLLSEMTSSLVDTNKFDVSVEITDVDGTVYNKPLNDSFVFALSDAVTQQYDASLKFIITPKSGYKLMDKDYNIYDSYEIVKDIQIMPTTKVSTKSIEDAIGFFSSRKVCSGMCVNQITSNKITEFLTNYPSVNMSLKVMQVHFGNYGSYYVQDLGVFNKSNYNYIFAKLNKSGYYYQIEIELTLSNGSGFAFDDKSSPHEVSYISGLFQVSDVTELGDAKETLNTANNTDVNVYQYSLLSDLMDNYEFNHMNITNYRITAVAKDDHTPVNNEMNDYNQYGSALDPYEYYYYGYSSCCYKTEIIYSFDEGYTILDSEGIYQDTYTLTLYTSIVKRSIINVSKLDDIVKPVFYDGYLDSTTVIGNMNIGNMAALQISYYVVEATINGTKTRTTYAANAKWYFDLNSLASTSTTRLTIGFTVDETKFCFRRTGIAGGFTSYEYTWEVIKSTKKYIDLSPLNRFINDSSQFWLVGQPFSYYMNLYLSDKCVGSDLYIQIYSGKHEVFNPNVLTSVDYGGRYSVIYYLNALEGYSFGVDKNGQEQLRHYMAYSKTAKKGIEIDKSSYQPLGSGNNYFVLSQGDNYIYSSKTDNQYLTYRYMVYMNSSGTGNLLADIYGTKNFNIPSSLVTSGITAFRYQIYPNGTLWGLDEVCITLKGDTYKIGYTGCSDLVKVYKQ